jgi:hypothetical protein
LLGSKGLFAQKKEVEGNFKVFKSKLAVKDKESVPKLPDDEKEWYVISMLRISDENLRIILLTPQLL